MIIKKILKKTFFILFFLLAINITLVTLNINKAHAATAELHANFCNNNAGISWQVGARMYYAETQTWGSWIYVWANQTPTGPVYLAHIDFCSGYRTYGTYNFGTHNTNSKVKWATACADPTVQYSGFAALSTGTSVEYMNIDISCHKINYNGTGDCVYAACDKVVAGGVTGSIYFNSICPSTNYCATGGWIYGASCNSLYTCNDYCGGGGNNCTLYNRGCTGSGSSITCSTISTSGYSSSCGTASTCTPPAPTNLQDPTFCQGTVGTNRASGVTFQWNPVAYDSSYDLQYRRVGTTTWTTISGIGTTLHSDGQVWYKIPQSTSCVTGPGGCSFLYGIPIEWHVRGHTSSGHWGPTAYSSLANFTTADCTGGATITGNVYNDNDNSTTKNTGDTNHSGVIITLSNGMTSTTDANGNYSISNIPAGSYTVSLPASVTGYYEPIRTSPSIAASAGQTYTYNFRLVPLSSVSINVYNDYDGNGTQTLPAETASSGQTVTVTGGGAQTYTTNSTLKTISNLNPGSSTVAISGLQSGWKLTTTNPITAYYPPPTTQTVNFGVQPPPPSCVGGAKGITANPTTVNPGKTSALSINCTSLTGDPLTYTWYDDSSIAGDSVTNTNTNTSTWTAPNPYWTVNTANPTVKVCYSGTAVCTNSGLSNGITPTPNPNGLPPGILIKPIFTISGNVFVDQNKDGLQNGGDTNYTGAISVTSSGGTVSYPAPAGSYLVSSLPAGTYTISYSWPSRYASTNPKTNLRPATFTVTVGNASTGTPCTTNGALGAVCDANGNITTLRFGISNSLPWIQAISGDITGSSVSDPNGGGFSNPIPAGATCGTYTSLLGSVVGGGTTPGIVYSGAGSYDFGSGQASQNPYNWVVGGITYPDVYTPLTPGVIKTSYAYVSSIAKTSGITPTDISTYCGAGGLNSCQLPSNLPNGVYIANGDLTLSGPSYTFPSGKNFVVLVNGNLNLNTEIHVPVGSTATFTAANDITVAQTIGEATSTSTRANIEGYYSADKHFIINGVNSCPTTDLRLNVAGSIVVNAGLNSAASLATQANFVNGGFVNERDLCATDLQCPAFSIIERPDFVINAPDFFKTTRRVWREIAP